MLIDTGVQQDVRLEKFQWQDAGHTFLALDNHRLSEPIKQGMTLACWELALRLLRWARREDK